MFHSPNTLRYEALYDGLVREGAAGGEVLELGCGDGLNAKKIAALGARRVYGVDVSERFIDIAKRHEIPGKIEFAISDASQPFGGQFDLIVGRSILHHIDYRPVLRRLYRDNLRPGGRMVFMEPLGSNPLIKLYTRVVRRAHTADERSFDDGDLAWLRGEFPGFEAFPYNLVSLYAGIVSSKVFSSPNNALLRLADRIDVWAAARLRRHPAQFRHAVLLIQKPAVDRSDDGDRSR